MRISRICNMDLLMIIKDAGEINRENLKKAYLPPRTAGVVLGIETSLDSDLDNLIAEGYISYDGEKYKFIGNK